MPDQTKTLTFFGYSDDNFAYEVDGKDEDEIGCYGKPAAYKVSVGEVGLFIVGQYAPLDLGSWMVGISQLDEDVPLPEWPISYSWEGYSVRLSIVVPAEAVVVDADAEDSE